MADVVLFDVAEGLAKGKALDIAQSSPIEGFNINLRGTNNYKDTENSDVIIKLPAGVPRKPGMSRDDLLGINLKIIKEVIRIKRYFSKCFCNLYYKPFGYNSYGITKIFWFTKK